MKKEKETKSHRSKRKSRNIGEKEARNIGGKRKRKKKQEKN